MGPRRTGSPWSCFKERPSAGKSPQSVRLERYEQVCAPVFAVISSSGGRVVKMVRFLHMADVQLGMRAQDATEVGERLRDARFDTLKCCVELAESQEVDFVIIAGDLFEHNQVSAHTVSRAVQILQDSEPIPVYILPGNHDWLDAGSVYERPEFAPQTARNVVVLRERKPIEVREGCASGSRRSPTVQTRSCV